MAANETIELLVAIKGTTVPSNNPSLYVSDSNINIPYHAQTFPQVYFSLMGNTDLETTGIHIFNKPLAHMRRFQIMMRVPVGPAVLMARSSVNSSFSVLNSECLRIASRLAASSGLGTLTVKGEINLIMLSKFSLLSREGEHQQPTTAFFFLAHTS